MPIVKRLVCLANSRKRSGRCIAGKELAPDGRTLGWVRPVSARENEEVSEYERQYQDGSDPRVLDVVDVPLIAARPKGYQQENWLLDAGYYWTKGHRLRFADLARLADPLGPLWIDGHRTFNGRNDKIPLSLAMNLRTSLRLIPVGRLRLSVLTPREAFGDARRRVQGGFEHAGTEYRLWVTDPRYERAYLARADGDYEIGEGFLVVSLGEPYKDACYKLIATILERDQGPGATPR